MAGPITGGREATSAEVVYKMARRAWVRLAQRQQVVGVVDRRGQGFGQQTSELCD